MCWAPALTRLAPAVDRTAIITWRHGRSSGHRYEIKVYFRRSDQTVLNVSVFKTDFSWGVNDSDLATGITGGVTPPGPARPTFNNKALTASHRQWHGDLSAQRIRRGLRYLIRPGPLQPGSRRTPGRGPGR